MIAIVQYLAVLASDAAKDASTLDASISALKGSISSLDKSVNSLEGSSIPWEHLAIAGSVAVVIGVFGEVVVVVSEHRGELGDWIERTLFVLKLPIRPPAWRFWFSVVAIVTVGIGVLSEAWASIELASINSQLRSQTSALRADSDQLLSLVTQEAGDAVSNEQLADALAKDAKANSDAVAKQAAELTHQMSAATAELAAAEAAEKKEEQALTNMAVCLAPRIIPHWNGPNGSVVDPLRPYASSYHAIVEYVPDPEARRAAWSLIQALIDAGWKTTFVRQIDGLNDGVEIEPYHPVPGKPKSFFQIDQENKSADVADAFVDFLHSNNWQARTVLKDFDLSPNTIKIKIGLFPPTEYIAPPGAAEYESWADSLQNKSRAERKQLEDRFAEQDKKLLAQVPPALAARDRELIKQQEELRKKLDERFSQPCRAASGFGPPPLQ